MNESACGVGAVQQTVKLNPTGHARFDLQSLAEHARRARCVPDDRVRSAAIDNALLLGIWVCVQGRAQAVASQQAVS